MTPALWLIGVSTAPAQSQTLIEAVKFLFEGENYSNFETARKLEDIKENTFITLGDGATKDKYSRSHYKLENCILYINHIHTNKKEPNMNMTDIVKIDLNKIMKIAVSDKLNYKIENSNIIRTKYTIDISGSDKMQCFGHVGGVAKILNNSKANMCATHETIYHEFNSTSPMDMNAHTKRILAAHQYIKSNFCKGSAF